MLKNLGLFGVCAAMVLAMGAVATDIDRGTAAFVLARPIGLGAFLLAQAASLGLVRARRVPRRC